MSLIFKWWLCRIVPLPIALGLCIVGGLLLSQCLTLYITPVIYLYLESFQEWLTRKRPAKGGAAEANPAAV